MPPTTSAPLSIARRMSSSVPGSHQMPSWGNAMSSTWARRRHRSRAASTPSSAVSPTIVSTSTYERTSVTPWPTIQWMTRVARSATSSTV